MLNLVVDNRARQAGGAVMIVDDDDACREVFVDVLSAETDYEVMAVDCAQAARALAKSKPVALAILDVHLRDEDGFSLARDLMRRGTCVMFVSGDFSSALAERARQVSPLGIQHKRLDPARLVKLVQSAMARRTVP